jgi:hypothetical protein
MQPCTNCGRQLSPGMTVCPDCRQVIPSTPTPATYRSYQTVARNLSSQASAYQYSSKKTRGSNIDAGTQPTHKHSMSVMTATPPHLQSLQRHRIFSRIIITAIIILTMLLIISGAGLLYYTEMAHSKLLHAQSTATAQKIQSANVHNTAVVHIDATKSAVNQTHAKETAVAHVTAQAQATTTTLQNIYAQSTSGHPALDMSLIDGTNDKWDLYPTKDGGGCAFADNALHSKVFQTNYYSPCLAHSTNFHNFALEIQMTIVKGDEGGIIFRSNSHNTDFYSFRVRTDGTYGLILTQNDGHTTPLVYDKSDLIKTGIGHPNIVTIIALGNIFYLYMNRHYVGSVSDSSYSTGSIGVMAIDRKNQTDVAFNNLHIWKL